MQTRNAHPVILTFRRLGMISLLFLLTSCLHSVTTVESFNAMRRELDFGGFTWRVKSSADPVAPGPNFFAGTPDAVWVDERGLHLTIDKLGQNWYATEIFTKQRVGYGTYTFSVETDALSYDPSVVAGFFTWDTAPVEYNREIDIEFAAWGAPDGTKFQYVVQPYTDENRIEVFDPNLQGSSTTHRIIWLPDRLEFYSYHGPVDPDTPEAQNNLMHHWVFSGKSPSEGRVRFRINLWLFQGEAPQKRTEMVVTSFQFEPL